MRPDQVFAFDRYQLALTTAQLRRGKRAIPLPNQTFAVLCYLVEHAGQIVTKAELFEQLWPGTAVNDGALTFCIVELRKALGDKAKHPQFIRAARQELPLGQKRSHKELSRRSVCLDLPGPPCL